MTEILDFVNEEYLNFLDSLRESGVTNMFGARPYLEEYFPELDRKQATEILTYWMKTYGERHKEEPNVTTT